VRPVFIWIRCDEKKESGVCKASAEHRILRMRSVRSPGLCAAADPLALESILKSNFGFVLL
jgi:hypothetical protein